MKKGGFIIGIVFGFVVGFVIGGVIGIENQGYLPNKIEVISIDKETVICTQHYKLPYNEKYKVGDTIKLY